VHVYSGDPRDEHRDLTTHCMMIFVGLDEAQSTAEVPAWTPRSAEDVALDRHAVHLAALRTRADLLDRELPRVVDRV
jgi:acyl-CoA hydrolase